MLGVELAILVRNAGLDATSISDVPDFVLQLGVHHPGPVLVLLTVSIVVPATLERTLRLLGVVLVRVFRVLFSTVMLLLDGHLLITASLLVAEVSVRTLEALASQRGRAIEADASLAALRGANALRVAMMMGAILAVALLDGWRRWRDLMIQLWSHAVHALRAGLRRALLVLASHALSGCASHVEHASLVNLVRQRACRASGCSSILQTTFLHMILRLRDNQASILRSSRCSGAMTALCAFLQQYRVHALIMHMIWQSPLIELTRNSRAISTCSCLVMEVRSTAVLEV